MSQKTVSTLSGKHITISVILIILIRVLAYLINLFVRQDGISLMASVNICTAALIFHNRELIDRHRLRTLNNIGDSLLFTGIGIAAIGLLTWVSLSFLKAELMLPDRQLLIGIGYARLGMLIAFSIMEACMVNIGFKNLTDHLDVRHKELQAILISAILSGIFMTILFTTFDIFILVRTCPYWLLLTAILSYLYNQCHSIIPGIISLSTVNLAVMLIRLFF